MEASKNPRILPGVVLAASLALLGLAIGGIVAGMLNPRGMGFDQIATALGGMMIGAPAGLFVAIVLARRLNLPALRGLTLVSALLAGGLLLIGVYRARQDWNRAVSEASPTRPVTPTTATPPP